MSLRPLLLSAVVGIAALGALHSPAAQARGYVSISVGAPAPYYGNHGANRYGQQHRPGYAWVPGHWVHNHRRRAWVPGQYVRVRGYVQGRDPYRGHGGYRGVDTRVIYRAGPGRVVPRSYYPPGYLAPYDPRPRRSW